ncbi:FAD-dependent oxidoreductase, partial [Candidatus Bathyarchaeota archaeon]|nr:FAD-dependent oxidoreductase [Candidatus Bathyarchaeota archaeon]
AVIGGSNSALTAALLLAEYAKEVYLIYRKGNFFRAEPAWVKQVEKNKKIKVMFNEEVKEIYGEKFVQGIKLNSKKDLKLDGVFIEIGSIPDEKLSKQLGLETEKGYIKVNKKQETNVKGIYSAGDITNNSLKQIITACSEGAIAATSVYENLKLNN